MHFAVSQGQCELLPWSDEDVQRETEEESEVAVGERILDAIRAQ